VIFKKYKTQIEDLLEEIEDLLNDRDSLLYEIREEKRSYHDLFVELKTLEQSQVVTGKENADLRQAIVNLNDKKNAEIDELKLDEKRYKDDAAYYEKKYVDLCTVKRELELKCDLLEQRYNLTKDGYDFVEIYERDITHKLQILELEAKGYVNVYSKYLDDNRVFFYTKLKSKTC